MSLLPPLLSPGDRIAVIAPAGNIKPSRDLTASLKIITDMGFAVSFPDTGWPGEEYLADSDEARADEFSRAWQDPEVKCIWALRGGYGSLRLLSHIDFSEISNNPKIFMGFSDITILLNHIFLKTGLITIHGPVVNSLAEADGEAIARVSACLKEDILTPLNYCAEILRAAPAVKGTLLGGNLCSLVSLLGTPYQPNFNKAILFLEDVNEPVYKIDRMLTQLSISGVLDDIKGIVLGDFSNTDQNEQNNSGSVSERVGKRLAELLRADIPIWANLNAGHCKKKSGFTDRCTGDYG